MVQKVQRQVAVPQIQQVQVPQVQQVPVPQVCRAFAGHTNTSPPPLTQMVALSQMVDRACAVTRHRAMLSLGVLKPNSNSVREVRRSPRMRMAGLHAALLSSFAGELVPATSMSIHVSVSVLVSASAPALAPVSESLFHSFTCEEFMLAVQGRHGL